jgi:hypothetical protein
MRLRRSALWPAVLYGARPAGTLIGHAEGGIPLGERRAGTLPAEQGCGCVLADADRGGRQLLAAVRTCRDPSGVVAAADGFGSAEPPAAGPPLPSGRVISGGSGSAGRTAPGPRSLPGPVLRGCARGRPPGMARRHHRARPVPADPRPQLRRRQGRRQRGRSSCRPTRSCQLRCQRPPRWPQAGRHGGRTLPDRALPPRLPG